MLRVWAEHMMNVIEGAVVFGMIIFVLSAIRDLWLTARTDK